MGIEGLGQLSSERFQLETRREFERVLFMENSLSTIPTPLSLSLFSADSLISFPVKRDGFEAYGMVLIWPGYFFFSESSSYWVDFGTP